MLIWQSQVFEIEFEFEFEFEIEIEFEVEVEFDFLPLHDANTISYFRLDDVSKIGASSDVDGVFWDFCRLYFIF